MHNSVYYNYAYYTNNHGSVYYMYTLLRIKYIILYSLQKNIKASPWNFIIIIQFQLIWYNKIKLIIIIIVSSAHNLKMIL